MKISIHSINSADIQFEMKRDHYTTAELLGTFAHPDHDGNEWEIILYDAADSLVFDTNGDPVWGGTQEFSSLVDEYGIDIASIQSA